MISESETKRVAKIKTDVIRQIILLHEKELRCFLGNNIPKLADKYPDFYSKEEYDEWVFSEELDRFIDIKMGTYKKRLGYEAKEYYSTYEVPDWATWEDSDNMDLMREVINYFIEEYADDIPEMVNVDLDSFDEMNYEMNTADSKFNFYISLALSLMESYEKGKAEIEELANNTVLKREIIAETIEDIKGELEEIKTKLEDIKKAVARVKIG